MSDEEFCDPSGASSRWYKDNIDAVPSEISASSASSSKRTISSNLIRNNQKKPKTNKSIDSTNNKLEKFFNSSERNNRKININKLSSFGKTGMFNWKQKIPDTSQNDRNESNITELSYSESELSDSDNSANSKSVLKNKSSLKDLPIIDFNTESSLPKTNKIDDDKSVSNIKYLNKIKSFTKVIKKNNDISLPPGMPPVIAGVPVIFPVTPYKSQISVMNAVIKGCKNEENCLLESPTGSGKTLALLCAALAWQTNFVKNHIEGSKRSQNHGTFSEYWKEESGDNFKNSEESKNEDTLKIPKIFYGTRTHKQIEQIIKEFKKTAYSDIPMTILSSREYSCIQPSQKGMTKTQICNELLDVSENKTCKYYGEKYKAIASNEKLNNLGFEMPWDIEDLVELGKKKGCCPYFAARDLMLEANIVFCPYNYLIDPAIQEAMQIKVDGNVIIVDEAHNIEETCRTVASYFFREDHLAEAIEDFKLVSNYKKEHLYESAYEYLTAIQTLMQEQYLQTPNNPNDEATGNFWTGEVTWALFRTYKLTDETYDKFKIACEHAIDDHDKLKIELKSMNNEEKNAQKYKKEKKNMAITFNTKKLIESLRKALECISLPEYNMSYRCAITQGFYQDAKIKVSENTWIPSKGGKHLRNFKFLCMNSEVTFNKITKNARCVILASGTLSPIASFESELGTKFHHKLHASHVISKDQVYVRAISHGPTGTVLRATYQNIQTLPFKDDLGRLIEEVCQSIPHGVLCFFSSYTSMKSNIERWQDTNLWEELSRWKRIFVEPRHHSELDEVMTEYREAAESYGALLFAVFRGKVAEGIDFSDNNARCVISIGIPFAVQTDPIVKLKREYNETNSSKGLLSGGEWYTVQAYRALNQALGRCIRHKNDWGAILLVDERLLVASRTNYLPKWIREMMLAESKYNLKNELRQFVKKQE